MFSDKKKLKEFITTKPVLQEMLKRQGGGERGGGWRREKKEGGVEVGAGEREKEEYE